MKRTLKKRKPGLAERPITVLKSSIIHLIYSILGDPGATSRDDAIFLGESLLQELNSPWELIVTEPVPEMVEFRPADWAEKYFSEQPALRSSRVTLSPSYTKYFSSGRLSWRVSKKNIQTKPRKLQALTCELGTNTLL